MKRLGVDNFETWDFIVPPGSLNVVRAAHELGQLGLISWDVLTIYGGLAAEFPIDPRLAHLLLHSGEFRCSDGILSLVALLSVADIFLRPVGQYEEADAARRQFAHSSGDHLTLLTAYHEFKLCISAYDRY
jgi:pre-mRNA-splicing factor ATP-dependent RNA helicase DHX15/PRP43